MFGIDDDDDDDCGRRFLNSAHLKKIHEKLKNVGISALRKGKTTDKSFPYENKDACDLFFYLKCFFFNIL